MQQIVHSAHKSVDYILPDIVLVVLFSLESTEFIRTKTLCILGEMPISTVNTMLTRFITSQHDHGGYLCVVTNNSLNVQEGYISLDPSSFSLAGQTRAREDPILPPCLPSFLVPPSPSPHLPTSLTFNPGRQVTEMESQPQLSPLSRSKTAKAAWCLGTCVSTNNIRSQVQQGER